MGADYINYKDQYPSRPSLTREEELLAFFGRKMQQCVLSFSLGTFLFLCFANKEKEMYKNKN